MFTVKLSKINNINSKLLNLKEKNVLKVSKLKWNKRKTSYNFTSVVFNPFYIQVLPNHFENFVVPFVLIIYKLFAFYGLILVIYT